VESFSAQKLLAFALQARDQKNFDIAEASLVLGTQKFPTHLDSYGQPAFIKELIRSLLMQFDWQRAHAIIDAPCFPRNDHWYELLFARAYEAAGMTEKATEWWTRTAENCPASWLETNRYFKRARMSLPVVGVRDTIESMLQDQDVARMFVQHGVVETVATVERFFRHSASASKQKGAETLLRIIENSKRKLRSPKGNISGKIPQISHRIWLTDPDAPQEPPEEYIERYLTNVRTGFGAEWRHIFWVQNEKFLPRTVDRIRSSGVDVKFQLLDGSFGYPEAMALIERFVCARKFAFAADVAKVTCLHKYGGLYCDLGIIFNSCIDGAIEPFDYVFHLWHALLFQLSLIAMPPKSALANAYLNITRQPEFVPRYLVESPLSGNSDLSLISGSAITTLFFLLFPMDVNACLMVSNRSLISHSAQRSWYRANGSAAEKLGGVVTAETISTFASEEIWNGKEEVFFGASTRF
jgi:hypothetical protein